MIEIAAMSRVENHVLLDPLSSLCSIVLELWMIRSFGANVASFGFPEILKPLVDDV